MTHYCMLNNEPRLEMVSAEAGRMEFALAADSGIAADEEHMHGLTVSWTDPNHITQTWISHKKGVPQDATVITLSRVQ